jgi:hypothetical protein
MTMLIGLDRHHLAGGVIDCVPALWNRAGHYINELGDESPELKGWKWTMQT